MGMRVLALVCEVHALSSSDVFFFCFFLSRYQDEGVNAALEKRKREAEAAKP